MTSRTACPSSSAPLAKLDASGGGDEPEALHEALFTAVHELSWRTDETVRMVVLVADAPPHIADYYGDLSGRYDHTVFDAVAQGIKIFPVGASGLNSTGEYVFRQLAQITGGKFVFLDLRGRQRPVQRPRHGDRPRRGELLGQHAGPAHRTPGAEELANLTQRVHAQPSSLLPQPVPVTLSCHLTCSRRQQQLCRDRRDVPQHD
ncbi:MAG: hypothetical protein R3A10_05110 [Caldilineaceae bacterium]